MLDFSHSCGDEHANSLTTYQNNKYEDVFLRARDSLIRFEK